METRWMYHSSESFAQLREAVAKTCVIPMGCIEKHGLHLPLGTDIFEASGIAYRASQLEPVCIFPDYIFGDSGTGSPLTPLGTVTLSGELQMRILEELCDEIAANGFTKIAVYNGHGGNVSWLNHFMRQLTHKKKPYVFACIHVQLSAPHALAEKIEAEGPACVPEMTQEDIDLVLKYHRENMRIGHACFGETSYMQAMHPDLVHLERLGVESGLSTGVGEFYKNAGITLADGGWAYNYPNSYDGHDPIGCNPRIGAAALRLEVERVAGAYRVLKEDTRLQALLDQAQEGWGTKERK